MKELKGGKVRGNYLKIGIATKKGGKGEKLPQKWGVSIEGGAQ